MEEVDFKRLLNESAAETRQYIVTVTAELREQMAGLATREDLEGLATREDLEGLATREDLEGLATREDLQGLATREELQGLATREELQGLATREDLQVLATREELEVLATREELSELRRENAAAHEETRRHFDVTAEHLHADIRLVAEVVIHLDGKIDREITALRNEMHEGFRDTHSLIKFVYTELDRRLQTLEP